MFSRVPLVQEGEKVVEFGFVIDARVGGAKKPALERRLKKSGRFFEIQRKSMNGAIIKIPVPKIIYRIWRIRAFRICELILLVQEWLWAFDDF